jgi:ABC-type amino acid transport substrate-binding protein
MKRLLYAFGVGMGLLLFFQEIGAETIKIGYFSHKPHQYLSDTSTKPRGATISYFEAVAAKMGYEVEWVGPLPFLRLLDYLKDGTLDGAAVLAMANLPELQDFVYYGDKPYYAAQAIFVVRQENPLAQITSIHDVEGYRVGWLANVTPSQFVQDNLAHLRMDYLIPGDTMWEQSLKKLLLGRIDAIHELDAYTLPFAATQMHLADQIKILPLPEPPQPVYVGFSRQSPKGKLLAEQYNAVQRELPFTYGDYVKLVQQEFEVFSRP